MSKYNEYPHVSPGSIPDTAVILFENLPGVGTGYLTKAELVTLFGGTPAPDTVPPVLQSIAVGDSDPSKLVLTYNESLDTTSIPPAANFNVAGKSVSSIDILGPTVNIRTTAAFVTTDEVVVAYTPTTPRIRDLAGNNAASFPNTKGTNNIGHSGTGSVTPPTDSDSSFSI